MGKAEDDWENWDYWDYWDSHNSRDSHNSHNSHESAGFDKQVWLGSSLRGFHLALESLTLPSLSVLLAEKVLDVSVSDKGLQEWHHLFSVLFPCKE